MARYKYDVLAALLASTHPETGLPFDADATVAAAQLNEKNIPQGNKDSLSGAEIWAATDTAEFASKTADQKIQWLTFCAIETHQIAGNTLAFVEGIFTATSNTETAIRALAKKPMISVLELTFGSLPNPANESHVRRARGEL